MQHQPPRYQHPQPPSNVPFSQHKPTYSYQQQVSPHKMQLSNHHQRREDIDGSGKRPTKEVRQQDQQKNAQKNDSNSFVPLQALKKQRNASKGHEQDGKRASSNASCISKAAEPSPKQDKVCRAMCFFFYL